jgi:hypothetical protein
VNFPQRLVEVNLIMSPSQKPLNGTDFRFAIDWDLQINFLKVNFRMLRLDDLSIEIFF